MAGKLIPLDAEPIGEDVVAAISSVFDKVQAGDVSSVAIAYVTKDGRGGQVWSDIPNVGLLIGSAARLLHHLNRRADDL